METLNENIIRPRYMERILPYIDKGIIKVLTGQRRVGKSYILDAVAKHISSTRSDVNIVEIDLEDFAFSHIKDGVSLNNEIIARLSKTKRNYIFIDEIQEVDGFDKVLRSLAQNPLNDIYVTGSNSEMLSTEMASRLAGRSVDIRVHPLSYREFLLFFKRADSDDSVNQYLRFGGMPYLRNLPSQKTWNEYLSGLTDSIVYRDIVARHKIRNTDFLNRLLLFLSDNIGQLFTAKRIVDYLKSQRQSSTVTSVQSYADYICEACLVNRCRRWDIEGRRYFEIGEKYYFEDLGIRNSIVGYRPQDVSGLLENAVYNHLCINGYSVKTGVITNGREIDFIAEKDGERIYIQVAATLESAETVDREFGNLMNISDNYRKYLVTLRDSAPNTNNGIEMVSLREFLAEE